METDTTTRAAAMEIGKLLDEHKGVNVMVLDVSGRNSWADYFVIATVTSSAHSRGLLRNVLESVKELGLEIKQTKRKIPDGDEWVLIDLGDVVVHLMTQAARSFYELEKLWFGAPDLLKKES